MKTGMDHIRNSYKDWSIQIFNWCQDSSRFLVHAIILFILCLTAFSGIRIALQLDLSLLFVFFLGGLPGLAVGMLYRALIFSFFRIPQNVFFTSKRIAWLLLTTLFSLFLIGFVSVPLELYLFEGEMEAQIARYNLLGPEISSRPILFYSSSIELIEWYNEIALSDPLSKYGKIQHYFAAEHPTLATTLLWLKILLGIVVLAPIGLLLLFPRSETSLNRLPETFLKPRQVVNPNKLTTQKTNPGPEVHIQDLDLDLLFAYHQGKLSSEDTVWVEKLLQHHPTAREILRGMRLYHQAGPFSKEGLKAQLDELWEGNIQANIQQGEQIDSKLNK